jgi:hypothetical protein
MQDITRFLSFVFTTHITAHITAYIRLFVLYYSCYCSYLLLILLQVSQHAEYHSLEVPEPKIPHISYLLLILLQVSQHAEYHSLEVPEAPQLPHIRVHYAHTLVRVAKALSRSYYQLTIVFF